MRKLNNLDRLNIFVNQNRAVLRRIITTDINAQDETKTILMKMTNAKSNTRLHRTEQHGFAHLAAVNFTDSEYYKLSYITEHFAVPETIDEDGEWGEIRNIPVIKIHRDNYESVRYCNKWILFNDKYCWIVEISKKTWNEFRKLINKNEYEYLKVKTDKYTYYNIEEIEDDMKKKYVKNTKTSLYQSFMTSTNKLLKYKISPRCIGMKAHTTKIKFIYKLNENEETGTFLSKKEAYDKLKMLFCSKDYKSWMASLNRGSSIKIKEEVGGQKIDTALSYCRILGDTLLVTIIYDCYLLNNNLNNSIKKVTDNNIDKFIIKKVTVPVTNNKAQNTNILKTADQIEEPPPNSQNTHIILKVYKQGNLIYTREKFSLEQARSDILSKYNQKLQNMDEKITIDDLQDGTELTIYESPEIMATVTLKL